MTRVLSCPSCQEEDALHGERTDAGIRIRCGRCQAQWMRDTAPRCATCGRGDIATRPRPLTQYSRGTQLSIVGWLDVPCCMHCDAQALTKSTGAGAPLPPDYRPAAMHRPQKDPATPTAPTDHNQPTGDR